MILLQGILLILDHLLLLTNNEWQRCHILIRFETASPFDNFIIKFNKTKIVDATSDVEFYLIEILIFMALWESLIHFH